MFNDGSIEGGDLPTIGTWTINRPEWQLIDLALAAYNKVGVALYSTLGRDAVGTINHSQISMIFFASRNLESLLQLVPKCPKLRIVVSLDELTKPTEEKAIRLLKEHNIRFMNLAELESMGKANPLPPTPPAPESIATICYSSGTTSNPKGVVLTHWNLASSAIAFSQGFYFRSTDPNIPIVSYLPLAHIVGRVIEFTAFLMGCRIGYYTGDPLKLIEDCQILKPVIFPAVPRILNRIAMKIQAVKAEYSIKGVILRYALETKIARIQQDGYAHHWFWDLLIFNKLKALADVPDLGYTAEDKPNPRGELCVRGASVFKEYYREPELTRQVKDDDGWFHTGDVGEIDTQVRIKVIDRVKNVMKLSQGEYVALDKVENGYATCPIIAQLFVYGNSQKNHLVGLVVPELPEFAKLATQVIGRDVAPGDMPSLDDAANNVRIKKEILRLMDITAKESGLQGFEKIKAIHVILEPFSTDNGMMTPTFKLRRWV
ncbi:hypothetical protein FRC16_010800 [Serendipita sp. 398]|nr:hypothetical protein FRC16_010800 [Serendipita sp. 398]